MNNFFEHMHITRRIIRIRDILNTFCYLVIGDDKAALIDTGNGFGNIKEYVSQLTDKEIIVFLTHAHFDHVNGAGLFDKVYLNEKDYDIYKEQSGLDWRFELYSQFDEVSNISKSDYNKPFANSFREIKDEQIFDIGGIHLQAFHVPGHTPGSMMFLIIEENVMLFGDACGPGTLFFDERSCSISEYRKALKKIKKYESRYGRIIRNHGTGESDKSLLDNVLELCDKILNNSDDKVPVKIMGIDLLQALKTDEYANREDGLQGNITYLESKRK